MDLTRIREQMHATLYVGRTIRLPLVKSKTLMVRGEIVKVKWDGLVATVTTRYDTTVTRPARR